MSEGKNYKDQPIPPRPSSSGAGRQSPAGGKPGENSRQESGQERGDYRRQGEILSLQDSWAALRGILLRKRSFFPASVP